MRARNYGLVTQEEFLLGVRIGEIGNVYIPARAKFANGYFVVGEKDGKPVYSTLIEESKDNLQEIINNQNLQGVLN